MIYNIVSLLSVCILFDILYIINKLFDISTMYASTILLVFVLLCDNVL